MTRAYVLDPATFAVQGLVDQSWERLKYTRRYFGMDTFTMTIQRARLYASTLQKGRLLYLPDEGNRIFLIEQIQSVAEGSAANDLMTVVGRSLEGIAMAERIVIPPAGTDYDRVSATPGETAMKHYVTDHASSTATDANRRIPSLVCIASGGTGSNVTVAGRYQYVFDLVKQIGLLTGQGWEILYNPTLNRFEFDVINGVDRHTSVFFDFAFETLEKWEELDSLADSKTTAIVAGQGEGSARDVVVRGSAATAFDRREAFIDARDIDLGATAELDSRGDAFLAAAKGETRLEAGIHQYGSFKYGVHWDMGDLVLVRNEERGISYTARVVEVEKSFETSASAPVVTAVIDRPFPTLKEQVSGPGAGAGAVDYPNNVSPDFDSIIMDKTNKDLFFYRYAAGVFGFLGGELFVQRTNSTDLILEGFKVGESDGRFRIYVDGRQLWGPGTGTFDLQAIRVAPGFILFDSNGTSVPTQLALFSTSGQRSFLTLAVAGDTAYRTLLYGDATLAGLYFGPGNAANDVRLYRSGAKLLEFDDGSAGNLTQLVVRAGSINNVGGDYYSSTTKVVGQRRTGWTAPTGTAARGTFATATVTLNGAGGVAEHLKALIDDLTTHGLIGT